MARAGGDADRIAEDAEASVVAASVASSAAAGTLGGSATAATTLGLFETRKPGFIFDVGASLSNRYAAELCHLVSQFACCPLRAGCRKKTFNKGPSGRVRTM